MSAPISAMAELSVASAPTHKDIQDRAYQLWQSRLRHGIEGTAEHDWLAAERELSEDTAEDELPEV